MLVPDKVASFPSETNNKPKYVITTKASAMKLSIVHAMLESKQEFTVYQVTSPNTDRTYYGYTVGHNVEEAFRKGAGRDAEPDRGDVRMLNVAGDAIRVKALDIFNDEIEAFMERNDLRARDPMSITGPTNFPVSMFQRARSIDPERVKRWKLAGDINTVTAREAMGPEYKDVAAYSHADIKALVAAKPELRQQLIKDLDTLYYPDFKAKYFA